MSYCINLALDAKSRIRPNTRLLTINKIAI